MTDQQCAACGVVLQPIPGSRGNLDNALIIEFKGGYGMFVDPLPPDPPMRALLCHECAHKLTQENPWMHKMIDPYNSHSHSRGQSSYYGSSGTGMGLSRHHGWDLPHYDK